MALRMPFIYRASGSSSGSAFTGNCLGKTAARLVKPQISASEKGAVEFLIDSAFLFRAPLAGLNFY
jgi:hypothetical protein